MLNTYPCVFSDEKSFNVSPKVTPQNDRVWLRKRTSDGDAVCSASDDPGYGGVHMQMFSSLAWECLAGDQSGTVAC